MCVGYHSKKSVAVGYVNLHESKIAMHSRYTAQVAVFSILNPVLYWTLTKFNLWSIVCENVRRN